MKHQTIPKTLGFHGFGRGDADQFRFPAGQKMVDACEDWLGNIGHTATIHPRNNSYALKHYVERYCGFYISNGALICAAIRLGFKYRIDGPNALFAMDRRDIASKRKAQQHITINR